MQDTQKLLIDEISDLPLEKIGRVLSYVRFVKQEPEPELWLLPEEEKELDALYDSGDFADASEVEAKVRAMPND